MKFKTVGDLVTYFKTHYGIPHRICIKKWFGKPEEYYWYSVIPVDILRLPVVNNRWSTNFYVDECGITRMELLIN